MTNVQKIINELFTKITSSTDQSEILDNYNTLTAVNEIVYLFKAGYINTANEELYRLHFDTMTTLIAALKADGY